jgi:hypothetical protein
MDLFLRTCIIVVVINGGDCVNVNTKHGGELLIVVSRPFQGA